MYPLVPKRSCRLNYRHEKLRGGLKPPRLYRQTGGLKGSQVRTFQMLLGNSARPSLLDTILRTAVKKGARQGFGIADEYRAELQRDKQPSIQPLTTTGFAFAGKDFLKTCGCGPGIEENLDSSLSCSHCGVQVASVEMRALTHEKAIRADEDPPVHADAPSHDNNGIMQPLMDSTFGARTETAEQLRQRTAFAIGGSRLSKRASNKFNCGDADAKVKRQAVRDFRQRSAVSEQLYICNRKVQDQLKTILDRVGMVQPMQQFIQTNVYNLLVTSEQHVCACKARCELDLSKKPPGVLAVACTKVACESMMAEDEHDCRIPGNLTKSELGRALDNVMRVPIRSDANQLNATMFAVKRLLELQAAPDRISTACGSSSATMEVDSDHPAIDTETSPSGGALPAPSAPPNHPNPNTTLALTNSSLSPTARQEAPTDVFGTLALNQSMRQSSSDSLPGHDIFFKIRDAVWSVTTLKKLSQALHSRVFEQLAKPAISLWARESGLPAEVSGILLLQCTLAKMPRTGSYDAEKEALEAVLQRTCSRTMVSQTTARMQYERLDPLVDTAASSSASSIDEMLI